MPVNGEMELVLNLCEKVSGGWDVVVVVDAVA